MWALCRPRCPEVCPALVPSDVVRSCLCGGRVSLVLITEYWAPRVVTQYNETKITVFSQASCSLLTRKPWCHSVCCWLRKCFGEGLWSIQIPARDVCMLCWCLSALLVCSFFLAVWIILSSRIVVPFAWSGSVGDLFEMHWRKKAFELLLFKSYFLLVFQEGVPLSPQLEVLPKCSKPSVGLNNIIFTWNFLF